MENRLTTPHHNLPVKVYPDGNSCEGDYDEESILVWLIDGQKWGSEDPQGIIYRRLISTRILREVRFTLKRHCLRR